MKHVVVVGDMKLGRSGDTIVTHALGSCLGLMVHDPVAQVGGLLPRQRRIAPQRQGMQPRRTDE